jgi:hypothetical protein
MYKVRALHWLPACCEPRLRLLGKGQLNGWPRSLNNFAPAAVAYDLATLI